MDNDEQSADKDAQKSLESGSEPDAEFPEQKKKSRNA
jgi:hypothetical protein